jgi:hypothetical protein
MVLIERMGVEYLDVESWFRAKFGILDANSLVVNYDKSALLQYVVTEYIHGLYQAYLAWKRTDANCCTDLPIYHEFKIWMLPSTSSNDSRFESF